MVVVIGATGVGKTARAIELAREYQCPIISADSRQIYGDLPIGTAAPTLEEQKLVKHHLVGFKTLTETYNAGQFARDAEVLLHNLFQKHDRVVLVGGSMMYVDALCKGLDELPAVPNEVREEVREEYKNKGLEWLQSEVQQLDPSYWQEVDRQNPQRLMHCVEVCRVSGKTYSDFRKKGKLNQGSQRTDFDIEYVLVERPREELYERINLRVDKMLEDGLLEEARRAFTLLNIPLDGEVEFDYATLPNSVNTVGYKELLHYFRGEWTLERAVEMIKQNSRHYAKRQITWWRSQFKKQDL
ncbi:MAG: tRNA (adenosine(37)-N6)-dimethylallyltransferase MiaA [Paludibacteraceae bacterium]|nr:tRNA (adenosine(37)-N6)-dimethylallyltransferase MiaA [Paludibacteraceae bacterium]